LAAASAAAIVAAAASDKLAVEMAVPDEPPLSSPDKPP